MTFLKIRISDFRALSYCKKKNHGWGVVFCSRKVKIPRTSTDSYVAFLREDNCTKASMARNT